MHLKVKTVITATNRTSAIGGAPAQSRAVANRPSDIAPVKLADNYVPYIIA